MCGIIGYIGKKQAMPILMDGLRKESYRGYDSSGIVVFDAQNNATCLKAVGKLENLENKIQGQELKGEIGIGHVRWATHGEVTETNAHPHTGCQENIFVVHNGIIENYREIREKLIEKGHKFVSETDTEVVAHLVEHFFDGNLEDAVRKALKLVKGAYALAVVAKEDPNKIVVAKLSSPLIIGIGKDEYLVASDQNAIAPYAKKIITLEDNEVVTITPDDLCIIKEREPEDLEIETGKTEKGKYPHFMLKEIMEQADSIEMPLKGRVRFDQGLAKLGGLDQVSDKLKDIERINIVACGTAYLAGLTAEYMLEEYAGIPCEVDFGSEFRYRKPILNKKTVVLAISQSGETADTLAGIKEAKEKGVMTLGIVNAVGSTIARETDAGIYNHAGPEIGVASTKAFTSQLTVLALLALFLGRQRQMSLITGQNIARELLNIPALIRELLKSEAKIKELAEKYKNYKNFFFIGRKYNFPIACEGALKLKEISYIHAEGYSGGEMKHGPIALIDESFPTIALCPSDSVYEKMVSNIEEIKARKGPVIAIATEGNEKIKELVDDVIYIPKTLEMLTPILSVIPLQLFAYYTGVLNKCDVDKPRNLAKSVTVE